MDLKDRLMDNIDSLSLSLPLLENINSDSDSISLVSQSGSTIVQKFYDNTVIKQIQYQIRGKSINASLAEDTLDTLTEHLINMTELSSDDNSFQFSMIQVDNEPYFEGIEQNDRMTFYFSINFFVEVII